MDSAEIQSLQELADTIDPTPNILQATIVDRRVQYGRRTYRLCAIVDYLITDVELPDKTVTSGYYQFLDFRLSLENGGTSWFSRALERQALRRKKPYSDNDTLVKPLVNFFREQTVNYLVHQYRKFKAQEELNQR